MIEVQRYLLVLDMDLLELDAQLDLEPINYLVERHEEQACEEEPCEVVVLSLVTDRPRLPSMELLLGARVGKFPVAPRPDHDVDSVAEHRLNLTVQHLKALGHQASGLISGEDLTHAVRSETHRHDYDHLVLMIGRQRAGWLTRFMRLDPVHRLQRGWGTRLTVFRSGHGPGQATPTS